MVDAPSSLLSVGQNIVNAINGLIAAFSSGTPRLLGTFAMPAAASLTVPQPGIESGAFVSITATNAAAGTLMGSVKSLYVSSITAGTGFSVATANAAAAAGTETFNYEVVNPS